MSEVAQCIQACIQAAVDCDRCANACLHEKEVAHRVRCIVLSNDCAILCRTAASLLSHGSPFARKICELAESACVACSAECDRFVQQHHHFQACADACRLAAIECRAYASSH
jgi:hypothetical protein